MKILIFNNQEFKAEKIIKNEDSIIGYIEGKEVFTFKGIKDFSLFTLKDGAEFDIEITEEQQLLSTVLLENANIKEQLKQQQELCATLTLQVTELREGKVNV